MTHSTYFRVLFLFALSIVLFSCKEKAAKVVFEPTTGEYLKKEYATPEGSLNYRIYYPEGFSADKKYPVLLFLHGAGERGSDNEAQLIHGSELIAAGMNKHQAIAILPQCPKEDYWVRLKDAEKLETGQKDFVPDVDSPPSDAMQKVIKLLTSTLSESYIDKDRVYVSGLSMGGMGTFDLLWRMSGTFAAGMPICGAGSTDKAPIIAKTPVRIFHGDVDVVVAVQESQEMISAIKEAGGDVTAFIYPDINHDSWTNAFAEPDFISWLFTHQLAD